MTPEHFVKQYRLLPNGMMSQFDIITIIKHLTYVANIPGDVVELGCNQGTASLFIQRYLLNTSTKMFHVCDSFQGLPDRSPQDGVSYYYPKGSCYTSQQTLIRNFEDQSLQLPVIHAGWFKDIDRNKFPYRICFALLDGDLYSSIIDSLRLVWPRLSRGGIILVHDIFNSDLPGVKRACLDFLADKMIRLGIDGSFGLIGK